jgi:hypothetical protein
LLQSFSDSDLLECEQVDAGSCFGSNTEL